MCLIGFFTTFKLLFFVLDFVLHRFWCPNIFEKKWDTPLCSCYFSRHTRACTTHLDMCLLFILKLAWTQGRVPLNDMYILFKLWCVYGNRNKWYTDWDTRLLLQEYWDYTYLFRPALVIGSASRWALSTFSILSVVWWSPAFQHSTGQMLFDSIILHL